MEKTHSMSRTPVEVSVIGTTLLLAATIFSPVLSGAITLNDNGSKAMIDPNSAAGMNWWDVDGVNNQLQKQWFYYRTGGGLAQPINTISAASILNLSGNQVSVIYTSPGSFSLQVDYTLNGGGVGSGNALIKENISILNLGTGSLDFHLFQYSNFDLLGPDHDSVGIATTGSGYDSVVQWQGAFGITEGIISPAANRAEAALAFSTETSLTTIPGYDLNNNLSLLDGDVTWSFQWDNVIAGGDGLFIFKDKSMTIAPVPEPSSIALMALGLAAIRLTSRRRSVK